MTALDSFAVSGAAVRAAERPLLEAGRGDELMRRAAWALAGHVLDVLRERKGRVAGTVAAALVGSGNNGGDALWALAFLRRRGVACTAVPTSRDEHGSPRLHAAGAAASTRVSKSAPRARTRPRRPTRPLHAQGPPAA